MLKTNFSTVIIGGIIIVIIAISAYTWFIFSAETQEEREIVEAPRTLVPAFIAEEGDPIYDQNRIYFRDYSNLMHGISIVAALSRNSELGHSAYRDGRYHEQMEERAERWLNLMTTTDHFFNSFGQFSSWFERVEDGWASGGVVDLADYPHGVYAYHMHHRGDYFTEFGSLEDRIVRLSGNYISAPGMYLLGEHYRTGRFYHSDGSTDHRSMSYGMGGIHGHAYAWVRWKKPGGADDMGLMEEDRLTTFLGYDSHELTDISREVARTLDRDWNHSRNMYDFEEEPVWHLDALGALIRGHKSIYDMLYMFGDENDKETAKKVFERSILIYEQLESLLKPWGLPAKIRFTESGAEAASSEVDLYQWYQFVNSMDGGYGWLREREATSRFFERFNPDVKNRVNEMTDSALMGALDYHHLEGRLVSRVDYNSGEVTDRRTSTSTTGMFITAAGNHYTNGNAFARPGDWSGATDEVRNRSVELYDAIMLHVRELELLMLLME